MQHVLFLHIPKTGGYAVELLLSGRTPSSGAQHFFFDETDWEHIEDTRFFFTHAPLHIRNLLPRPLFAFTFLREPVAQVISYYNHILRQPDFEAHKIIVGKRLSLPESLADPTVATLLVNPQTRTLGSSVNLRPLRNDPVAMNLVSSVVYQSPADEHTLQRALSNLATLDFVGYTESLAADVRTLGSMLGIAIDEVPYVNETPVDYDWPLPPAKRTPETEAAVRAYCALDCALYEAAPRLERKPYVEAKSPDLLQASLDSPYLVGLRAQYGFETLRQQMQADLEAKQKVIDELTAT